MHTVHIKADTECLLVLYELYEHWTAYCDSKCGSDMAMAVQAKVEPLSLPWVSLLHMITQDGVHEM